MCRSSTVMRHSTLLKLPVSNSLSRACIYSAGWRFVLLNKYFYRTNIVSRTGSLSWDGKGYLFITTSMFLCISPYLPNVAMCGSVLLLRMREVPEFESWPRDQQFVVRLLMGFSVPTDNFGTVPLNRLQLLPST